MISSHKISVVIPSIGTRDLIPTINSLNNSSIAIEEIIISIPFNTEIDLEPLKEYSNLVIHKSKFRGQVLQRIEGFKIAKNQFVVQIDDDIIVEKKCIELMYNFLKLNDNSAVSAHFHDIISKKSIYLNNMNNLISKVYNKIKMVRNSKLNGDISISGFETYPNFSNLKEPFISGWIPGGLVMHLKKNLILSNFFPFKGKAYCEDLFHSIALKKNNTKLYYHPTAIAFLEIENIKSNFNLFLRHLKSDIMIRKQLVKQNNMSIPRMYLVYSIKLFSYLFK